MIERAKIPCLMGAEFNLRDEDLSTSNDLAELFRKWVDEVDGWENKPLSEIEIVKGKIVVTLKDGIFGV